MRTSRAMNGIVACVFALAFVATGSTALAYSSTGGYTATDFATGFAMDPYDRGPIGLDFDAAGNLYVISLTTATLYKFGPAGGAVSPSTEIGKIDPRLFALAFGADGNLYASTLYDGGVYQISTSTGAILRTVAFLNTGIRGLARDPLSGDLFVASSIGIERIAHYESGPGTVTPYTPSLTAVDGIAFGPDGTLYAADVASQQPLAIAGTGAPNPGAIIRTFPTVYGLDGIGVGIASSASPSGFLMVNSNLGFVAKIDVSTNPVTTETIFSGGSRGDFTATGPDGCLYATQSDRIVKITNADGTCSLFPPRSFLASGSFVLGDNSAATGLASGAPVTWWSAKWAGANPLSGGVAPAAFKGFADTLSAAPPWCGGTWTARTGDSADPPATVPPYMAVVVTSGVQQDGATASGNVIAVVLVKTAPGYGPSPGHVGTGTIVGVLCLADQP